VSENATAVKRRSRLGGWAKIGIVASVLWVLGAGTATHIDEARRANEMYRITFDDCTNHMPRPLPSSAEELLSCYEKARISRKFAIERSWDNAAFAALAPLPLFWLIAWGIRAVYRRVRRGFASPTHSPA
jgi:hypothetical protein